MLYLIHTDDLLHSVPSTPSSPPPPPLPRLLRNATTQSESKVHAYGAVGDPPGADLGDVTQESKKIPSNAHGAGAELFFQSFLPKDTDSIRAIVIFVHGIGEYSTRYDHVLRDLASSKQQTPVAAFSYDQVKKGRKDRGVARGACVVRCCFSKGGGDAHPLGLVCMHRSAAPTRVTSRPRPPQCPTRKRAPNTISRTGIAARQAQAFWQCLSRPPPVL
jgi:hypothetical protein